MKVRSKKVDIFKLSLKGIKLIEASAGTGKTLTIILLYLRLLLGISNNNTPIRALSVNQILIVTFTNKAKEELYYRIKQYINDLHLTCINNKSVNPIFTLFLKNIKDKNKAIDLLNRAKNKIDCAAIYTIHEFCNVILQSSTFDYSLCFKQKILKNEDQLYLQATQDFWRKSFYVLPKEIIKIIYKEYSSPEYLLKKIKPILKISLKNFSYKLDKNETFIKCHEKNIKKINVFKKTWLLYHDNIYELIKKLKINKKVYNTSNMIRWIKNITQWSEIKTENYYIPSTLKYFTKKKIEEHIIQGTLETHIFFKNIEKFLNKNITLNNFLILYAIKKISQLIKKVKEKKMILGFDDLLNKLLKILEKDKSLKKHIKKIFPAVFVDEFQDTDLQQYHIFRTIYMKKTNIVLFLIGDPKQAIYSFRGADIFSYLYAKSHITKRYYLDTNWRSSIDMCTSINILFSKNNNPFLNKNILFSPIIPSNKNCSLNFKIKGQIQQAVHFFLQPQKNVSLEEYYNWIGKQCANEIHYWITLARTGEATITTKNGEKILTENDIVVLVRNKIEANVIQEALHNVNIKSIYTSHKENIFHTKDSEELLWILKSILEPTNEHLLQQSINTFFFQKLVFKNNHNNKKNDYTIIETLYKYQRFWNKKGIFYTICALLKDYKKNNNIVDIKNIEQRKINILYLGELLEIKSRKIYQKKTLIKWFEQKILKIDTQLPEYYVPLSNINNIIKIITIHKSKGLEYPITWIPFSIDFHHKKDAIYHDPQTLEKHIDIEKRNKSLKKSEIERLSEDIRLLYVALTRSIIHCSIGVATLTKNKKRAKDYSDIHKSALGYILQNGCAMNYSSLYDILKKISCNNFIKMQNDTIKIKIQHKKEKVTTQKESDGINKKFNYFWKITSYTKLYQENILHQNKINNINIEKKIDNNTTNNKKYTINNFPTGKKTGKLIHKILQTIKFEKNIKYSDIEKTIQKYNIKIQWTPVLLKWINYIINTNLNKDNIILSQLKKTEYIQELEFFLPIKKTLNPVKFNHIIQLFDPISHLSPKIFFNDVTGILKGFIDLIFLWNKKYYILDYKSNWLGKDNKYYSRNNIKKEIIQHRYDLQYQIYTLAVHQYLTNKLKKYTYQENFGGIFYLFLRGMNKKNNNNSIFYTCPNYQLIKKLQILFTGKNT